MSTVDDTDNVSTNLVFLEMTRRQHLLTHFSIDLCIDEVVFAEPHAFVGPSMPLLRQGVDGCQPNRPPTDRNGPNGVGVKVT